VRCPGKAGVVTGTSRGLAREILPALCAEGASIVALSRDAEVGRRGVEEAVAVREGRESWRGEGCCESC
jgi:NAD(P)-dependent dehydrogenase (short-subunit alcohol dehydrogenase family)